MTVTRCLNLKLIMLGAPGSGKGTISKRIVRDFNLKFLSSGDLLRHEIATKSEIGIACENYINKGELVPDKILDKVLFQKLQKISTEGWLLDGYPRKISQATTLYKEPYIPDLVVDLQVPFSEIVNRLNDRWVHPGSGRVYNLQYNKPKVEGKDDVTGEPLVQRIDDLPETVLARLENYRKQTLPVSEFFRNKGKLVAFHGTESDVIWPEVRKYLEEFVTKKAEFRS